jgi:hypothetical protein
VLSCVLKPASVVTLAVKLADVYVVGIVNGAFARSLSFLQAVKVTATAVRVSRPKILFMFSFDFIIYNFLQSNSSRI